MAVSRTPLLHPCSCAEAPLQPRVPPPAHQQRQPARAMPACCTIRRATAPADSVLSCAATRRRCPCLPVPFVCCCMLPQSLLLTWLYRKRRSSNSSRPQFCGTQGARGSRGEHLQCPIMGLLPCCCRPRHGNAPKGPRPRCQLTEKACRQALMELAGHSCPKGASTTAPATLRGTQAAPSPPWRPSCRGWPAGCRW